MVRMGVTGCGVRHGLNRDLAQPIEDVHFNAYAELDSFYVGGNVVIELSDSDEEGHRVDGHNEEGHEGEEQDNNKDEEDGSGEIPMPPLQVRQDKPKHFVFVHGMGGGAWFWYEIQTLLLQRIGLNSTAVDLTSHGMDKAIADDITTVAEYVEPLLDAIAGIPGEVILVGHGLGGGVIAYASEIYPHKVSKAIYVSACMPTYHQSMFSALPNNTFTRLLHAGDLWLHWSLGTPTPTSAVLNLSKLDMFYMSKTPKRYVNLAKVLMTPTPYRPGTEILPLTPSKFGKVDRYYVRTGADLGVLTADQDLIIAANPPKRVLHIPDGDHAVFFSAPQMLFGVLLCISIL